MSERDPETVTLAPAGSAEASPGPDLVPGLSTGLGTGPGASPGTSLGPDPWAALRQFTEARIALGSVGASLPTAEVLGFAMAHARARDAVHLPLAVEPLARSLELAGFAVLEANSRANSRTEYLARPDLGRRLHPGSVAALTPTAPVPRGRLTVVVADGLSALAATRHALPLLLELRDSLAPLPGGWCLDSVVLATQARVALADEIGELRGAEAVVILLGERPGLSCSDSLGMYMTYAPRKGRLEAERNCISNVRDGGLSYPEAVRKLRQLLDASRLAGGSGLLVKDRSDANSTRGLSGGHAELT